VAIARLSGSVSESASRRFVRDPPASLRSGRASHAAPRPSRRDFFARAAARSSFLDIALVEPPQIIIQPFIGGANEIFQRVPGKIVVLVVDRVDAGSV
jgi:hypothetical protein